MQKGDFVEIEYVGRIKESGEVFDLTSEELAKETKIYNKNYAYGPIAVIVGAGHVLPGIDEQLEKMNAGDKITFEIPPAKAFGLRKEELNKIFQASEFKNQRVTPVAGQHITFQNGVRGKIISASSGRVKVDFNHPLAGKALEYELKVNKKIDSIDEQINSLIAFYLGAKATLERKIDGKKLTITVPSNMNLHPQVKKAIADSITRYVKSIEEVNFVEAFRKE